MIRYICTVQRILANIHQTLLPCWRNICMLYVNFTKINDSIKFDSKFFYNVEKKFYLCFRNLFLLVFPNLGMNMTDNSKFSQNLYRQAQSHLQLNWTEMVIILIPPHPKPPLGKYQKCIIKQN